MKHIYTFCKQQTTKHNKLTFINFAFCPIPLRGEEPLGSIERPVDNQGVSAPREFAERTTKCGQSSFSFQNLAYLKINVVSLQHIFGSVENKAEK